MATINHSTERNLASKMIDGIKTHLKGVKSVTLNGVSHKPAELIKQLEQRIETIDSVATMHAQARMATATNREERRNIAPTLAALRATVIAMFGRDAAAVLTDFGFSSRAAAKPTVETKAAAADKLRATRKARNTMGKRQRLKVRGDTATPVNGSSTPPLIGS